MMVDYDEVGKRPVLLVPGGKIDLEGEICISSSDLVGVGQALAHIYRFTGRSYYTVAQHCCQVAQALWLESGGDKKLALAGLLHDAAEAYVGDILRPIKAVLGSEACRRLADLERRIGIQILKACEVPEHLLVHPKLKEADLRAAIFEVEACRLGDEEVREEFRSMGLPELPAVLREHDYPWEPAEAAAKWTAARYNLMDAELRSTALLWESS